LYLVLGCGPWSSTAQSWIFNQTTSVSSANYTVQTNDQALLVNTTVQSITIYLPSIAASRGRGILIVDDSCTSQTNQIMVNANGNDTFSSGLSIYYVSRKCYSITLFGGSKAWFSVSGL
jgi:hypothetical protein